jgi:hypothetical protein
LFFFERDRIFFVFFLRGTGFFEKGTGTAGTTGTIRTTAETTTEQEQQ